jgi:hypothetical protein
MRFEQLAQQHVGLGVGPGVLGMRGVQVVLIGSQVTRKLTELAMKHSRWASSWSSRARSRRPGSTMVALGRRVTVVNLPPPSASARRVSPKP